MHEPSTGLARITRSLRSGDVHHSVAGTGTAATLRPLPIISTAIVVARVATLRNGVLRARRRCDETERRGHERARATTPLRLAHGRPLLRLIYVIAPRSRRRKTCW